MIAPLLLGITVSSRSFVVEQSGAVTEHSIRSTWRKITARSFSDQVRIVEDFKGYTFVRSDGTSCFDVSKDAYVSYAERKGVKGVLVIWRMGGIEFKKIARPVESIRFHEGGNVIAIETQSNVSATQTMLCRAIKGLPKLADFRGLVIGSNGMCAVVSDGNHTTVQSASSTEKANSNRIVVEKMLASRAVAVGRITGTKTPPDAFTRLAFSSNSHYMFDATVDSNETMKSVPFSDISGLFNSQGETWEWRSDGQLTDAFFVNAETFVFKIGDPFKMGTPGKLKRYPGGLYILNCHTKSVRLSSLTAIKERLGLAGSALLDANGL